MVPRALRCLLLPCLLTQPSFAAATPPRTARTEWEKRERALLLPNAKRLRDVQRVGRKGALVPVARGIGMGAGAVGPSAQAWTWVSCVPTTESSAATISWRT
jgi:hypothetical protein